MSLAEFTVRADKAEKEIEKLKCMFSKIDTSISSNGSESEVSRLHEENARLKEQLASLQNGLSSAG